MDTSPLVSQKIENRVTLVITYGRDQSDQKKIGSSRCGQVKQQRESYEFFAKE